MATPAYMSITGTKQGLITAGALREKLWIPRWGQGLTGSSMK